MPPPRVALVYPGQGAMLVAANANGTVCQLATHTSQGREVYAQAEQVLGLPTMRRSCATGDAEELKRLYTSQVAQYVTQVAATKALVARHPHVLLDNQRPRLAAAGMSLGELAALTAVGIVSFEDGLKIINARGMLFDRQNAGEFAVAGRPQGMVVVLGLDRADVDRVCWQARLLAADGGPVEHVVCSVANDLYPKAATIGGDQRALEHVERLALAAGAHKAKRLRENASPHTAGVAAMAKVLREQMREAGVSFCTPPQGAVAYSNLHAGPFEANLWNPSEYLHLQMINTVRWQEEMRNMAKQNYVFVDMGPADSVRTMLAKIPGVDGDRVISLEEAAAPGGDALLWPDGVLPHTAPIAAFEHGGHAWSIQVADMSDLKQILAVQASAWSEEFRLSDASVAKAIRECPGVQLKLICHGQAGKPNAQRPELAGFIVSQLVHHRSDLATIDCGRYGSICARTGRLVFPYAINVHANHQGSGISEVFWELMLWHFGTLDVDGLVGVTRTHRGYPAEVVTAHDAAKGLGAQAEALWSYVSNQRRKDPILTFHETHGARFIGMLPGYRPDDAINLGYGILIDYSDRLARNRRRATLADSTAAVPLLSPAAIATDVRIVADATTTTPGSGPAAPTATTSSGDVQRLEEGIRTCFDNLGFDGRSMTASSKIFLASTEHVALGGMLKDTLGVTLNPLRLRELHTFEDMLACVMDAAGVTAASASPTGSAAIAALGMALGLKEPAPATVLSAAADALAGALGGAIPPAEVATALALLGGAPAASALTREDVANKLVPCFTTIGYDTAGWTEATEVTLSDYEDLSLAQQIAAAFSGKVAFDDHACLLRMRTLGEFAELVHGLLDGGTSIASSTSVSVARAASLSEWLASVDAKTDAGDGTEPEDLKLVEVNRATLADGDASFPPESAWARLSSLEHLLLTENRIASLPAWLFHAPLGATLKQFKCSQNALRSLPSTIGHLGPALLKVNLAKNNLSSLPEEFGNFTQLLICFLGENLLTSLPESFGQLLKLARLGMKSNPLTCLPTSCTALTNVDFANFEECAFEALPAALGHMGKLQEVSFLRNRITLLTESALLGQMTMLKILNVNVNQIEHVPAAIGNLTRLRCLHMNYNKIAVIPSELARCTQMRVLEVACNKLRDRAMDLTALTDLRELNFVENYLGALPQMTPDTLEKLQVSGNLFAERGLGDRNVFSDPRISTMANLHRMEVSNLGLRELPMEFGRLENLQFFYAPGNKLCAVPSSFRTLTSLRIANLNSNLFEKVLEAHDGIVELQMGTNCVTQLPTDMRRYTALEGLWLCANKVNGSMHELEEAARALPALKVLNLLGNNGIAGASSVRRLDSLGAPEEKDVYAGPSLFDTWSSSDGASGFDALPDPTGIPAPGMTKGENDSGVHFVSLGCNCQNAFTISQHLGHQPNFPFDWIGTEAGAVNEMFASGFEHITRVSLLSTGWRNVMCTIEHAHESFEDPSERSKFIRSSKRLESLLRAGRERLVFVRLPLAHEDEEVRQMCRLANILRVRFPTARFQVLVVSKRQDTGGIPDTCVGVVPYRLFKDGPLFAAF